MPRFLLALALLLVACQDEAPPPEDPAATASPSTTDVIPGETLLERFPEAVGPYPLGASSTDLDGALGYQVSRATARYTADIDRPGPAVVVNLLDLGTAEMAENMGFGWGTAADTTGAETYDGYPARVEASDRTRTVQVRLLVAHRFLVEVRGEAVARDRVDEAIRSLDLDGLAALAAG